MASDWQKYVWISGQAEYFNKIIGWDIANALAHVVLEEDYYATSAIEYILGELEKPKYIEGHTPENVQMVKAFMQYLLSLPEEWREAENTDMIDSPQEIKRPGNFYYGGDLDTKLGPLSGKKVWDKDRFNFDE